MLRRLVILVLVLVPIARASTPQGGHIVFTIGAGAVIVSSPDGTGRTTLTGGSVGFDPAWSPDGTRVAWARAGDPNHGIEIWTANADGSNAQALTSGAAAGDGKFTPTWSPDGTRIAYLAYLGNSTNNRTIWIVPAAGGTPQQVATGAAGVSVAWQPGGSLLLYEEVDSSNAGHLATVDAVSGAQNVLGDIDAGRVDRAVWSPDGTRVALVDPAKGLIVENANGTGRQVVDSAGAGLGFLAWSPDGASIAAQETRVLPYPTTRFGQPVDIDIVVVDVATGAERRLTGWLDPTVAGPFNYQPTWWPDGSRLYFRTGQPGPWEMNADGTCQHPVTQLSDATTGPWWQPGSFAAGALDCVQLRVRSTEARPQVALGEQGTSVITIENNGNQPATNVKVTVAGNAPATTSVLCGPGPVVTSCPLGTIGAGETRTINVLLGRATAGAATASFSVSADQSSITPADARLTLVEQALPCTIVGTWGPDEITGTPGNDRICGLPGADHINGGRGDDYLNGGSGQDTIIGGPGHDTIIGGGGADIIYARDHTRDYIDCGTEFDIAIVDKIDHVHHCERVLRR